MELLRDTYFFLNMRISNLHTTTTKCFNILQNCTYKFHPKTKHICFSKTFLSNIFFFAKQNPITFLYLYKKQRVNYSRQCIYNYSKRVVVYVGKLLYWGILNVNILTCVSERYYEISYINVTSFASLCQRKNSSQIRRIHILLSFYYHLDKML